ncbi:uncharacterized protein LOC106155515 [Lingula anatina]|uniref:Uncharacterized protein LOC106155515 n=2 Tax=Lingula anatina TaxID=7574 RepID=A0A1S3HIM3_LINAN|nr:uncharacterized protein LOC106155515 [Lingula anatina]|eukprot:XP_013385852.1 uncharacterized protein LOC106155515 [Lingula anatina]
MHTPPTLLQTLQLQTGALCCGILTEQLHRTMGADHSHHASHHHGAYYIVKHKPTGMVLDIRDCARHNGATICLWPQNGGDNQLWTYHDGVIKSKMHGKVLDVKDGHAYPGCDVILWDFNGGANQRWIPNADGTIVTQLGNYALDVMNNATHQGAEVKLWDRHGGANQQFKLERA